MRIAGDKKAVDLANVKMSMNPFCEIAVEEAVRMKEAKKATEVIAGECSSATQAAPHRQRHTGSATQAASSVNESGRKGEQKTKSD